MQTVIEAEDQMDAEEQQEETISALAELRAQADAAEEVVLDLLDKDPGHRWKMDELQAAAVSSSGIKRTPISIAINRLWQRKVVGLDVYLQVHRLEA
jgi:hypothetical protein